MSKQTYHDVNGATLNIADYVRRLPLGVPGRVLGFDTLSKTVLVEWPHMTRQEYGRDVERIPFPGPGPLPVLETWKSDSDISSPDVTWHVLGKWQNVGLEMWTCHITTPEHPEGKIRDCYAAYVRLDAAMVRQPEQERK